MKLVVDQRNATGNVLDDGRHPRRLALQFKLSAVTLGYVGGNAKVAGDFLLLAAKRGNDE